MQRRGNSSEVHLAVGRPTGTSAAPALRAHTGTAPSVVWLCQPIWTGGSRGAGWELMQQRSRQSQSFSAAFWRSLDDALQAGVEGSETTGRTPQERETCVFLGAAGGTGACSGISPRQKELEQRPGRCWGQVLWTTGEHRAVLATWPRTPCSPRVILIGSFTGKEAEPKYEKCAVNNDTNTARKLAVNCSSFNVSCAQG